MRFSFDVVQKHIRECHPGCPSFVVEHLAKQVAQKKWEDATLGTAVGITMQNLLRHEMTNYDTLLLSGMDRVAARKQVQSKINRMLKVWAQPTADSVKRD